MSCFSLVLIYTRATAHVETYTCTKANLLTHALFTDSVTYRPSFSNVAELGRVKLLTNSSSLKAEGLVALK